MKFICLFLITSASFSFAASECVDLTGKWKCIGKATNLKIEIWEFIQVVCTGNIKISRKGSEVFELHYGINDHKIEIPFPKKNHNATANVNENENVINCTEPELDFACQKESEEFNHLPPKYLTVEDWESCLSSQWEGSWKGVCIPKKRPQTCSKSSWIKLKGIAKNEPFDTCHAEEGQKDKKGKWYIGAKGESCTSKCNSHKLKCTNKGLQEHNNDVDSSVKLMELIDKLDGRTTATKCSGSSGKAPGVPNLSPNTCDFSSPSRPLPSFNCNLSASPKNKQRLCWCHSPFLDGWYIGEKSANCVDTCKHRGLKCSNKGLKQHNKDVDSSTKLLNLIDSLGGKTSAEKCNGRYGNAKDVPNFSSKECLFSSSTRKLSSFACKKGTNNSKQRLCYCNSS